MGRNEISVTLVFACCEDEREGARAGCMRNFSAQVPPSGKIAHSLALCRKMCEVEQSIFRAVLPPHVGLEEAARWRRLRKVIACYSDITVSHNDG